jgi:protoporphyrinogen oxidase
VVSAIYHSHSLAGLDTKAAVELTLEDLKRGLGHSPGDLKTARIHHWRGVIPRYGVNHDRMIAKLHDTVRRALPKLVMAGTWTGGVSVEDRLNTGVEAAGEVHAMVDGVNKGSLKEADA